jgi:hypothetical protein
MRARYPAQLKESTKVRGYMKPASAFYTLTEWEELALELLELQGFGIDSRGGELSCKQAQYCNAEDFDRFVSLVSKFFGYQLTEEVDRWDLLTKKNVLDFIEDFVNHRFWGLEGEFGPYFPNIQALRIAYFYSRGDMEPYVMLDDEYTEQLYGSTNNPKVVQHYTSPDGLLRIRDAIESGNLFDISTFTVAKRPFFRPESNIIVTLEGNIRAGFRSDIKSMAIDNGRRACNMYRLEYPGRDLNNICYELETCDGDVRTSLWNEYITTPIRILEVETV